MTLSERRPYATEFFSRTFGKNAEKRQSRFISSLARLQDALGELNDRATARQCALAVAGRSAEPRLLVKAVRDYGQWSDAKRFRS
jgi:CHAD domain-containing protein